jgi:hypothetical protein
MRLARAQNDITRPPGPPDRFSLYQSTHANNIYLRTIETTREIMIVYQHTANSQRASNLLPSTPNHLTRTNLHRQINESHLARSQVPITRRPSPLFLLCPYHLHLTGSQSRTCRPLSATNFIIGSFILIVSCTGNKVLEIISPRGRTFLVNTKYSIKGVQGSRDLRFSV